MSWRNEFIHRWDAAVLELMPVLSRHGAAAKVAGRAVPVSRHFSYAPDFCNVHSWEIPALELPIQVTGTKEIVEWKKGTADEQ